jgi:hypothetical protein
MVLRDKGDTVVARADTAVTVVAKGRRNMTDGPAFTFDTKSVDPTEKFHVPSLVRERAVQRAAIKVARRYPQYVTVGDYRTLSFDGFKGILTDLGFAPSLADRFQNELSGYIGSWR